MPSAKIKPSASRMPASQTDKAKNSAPTPTAIKVTTLVTTAISICSGLSSSPTLWVSRAILPNSVSMPVANTTRLARTRDHAGPGKDQILEFGAGCTVGVDRLGVSPHRSRLAGQGGLVHQEFRLEHQPRIRRNQIALLEQHHITRHEFQRTDPRFLPVTAHPDGSRAAFAAALRWRVRL